MNIFSKKLWVGIWQALIVAGIAFAAGRFVRHCHAGAVMRCGRSIDDAIRLAAEKLDGVAIALEKRADQSLGEQIGKCLEDVLAETNIILRKAAVLIKNASVSRI